MLHKILIIRFSSIGDIVLTTPVIRCLRKKYPDAAIHYLTKKSFKNIIESNPYVDKVHLLNNDFDTMMHELKEENFDYIIDLHHNLRTLRIKRQFKNTPSYSFNKLNVEKWVYTNFKWNILPKIHIVERYLATVAALGIEDDGLGLDYFIPNQYKIKQSDIPAAHQLGYIAVAIGAALATKKMPIHKLIALCKAIQYPIILLGGKEDYLAGEEIAKLDNVKIYNACGKFNLDESADLVNNAKLVVTHDTGLMHIAAALQKPIISIWGNTVPSFGMYPYYGKKSSQQYYIVQVNKLWCRPCSKIGYKKCPLGHFKCMENIAVNEIVNIVNEKLGLK